MEKFLFRNFRHKGQRFKRKADFKRRARVVGKKADSDQAVANFPGRFRVYAEVLSELDRTERAVFRACEKFGDF